MRLGDKIYRLRKKQGFSQDELGEKLNVSRQTVSKWELNQSIPETDKLTEISKLFNIDLSELTDDNIDLEDNKTNIQSDVDEQHPRKWLLVLLIIIAIAIVTVLANKVITDRKSNNNPFGIFNTFKGLSEKMSKTTFNNTFEFYSGTQYSISVSNLLDDVITNNKTNEKNIISVTYDNNTTSDSEQIKKMKVNIDSSSQYEVSLDYDTDGYINRVLIEKLEKEISTNSFNRMIEFYSGTKYGSSISYLIDEVIKSNNKNKNHIINVKYKSFNSSDSTEIRNLKKRFDTWTEYEVWVEYDEKGYIFQVNIEG